MLNRKIVIGLITVAAVTFFISVSYWLNSNLHNKNPDVKENTLQSSSESFEGAARYLNQLKANPYTNQISYADKRKAYEEANKMPATKRQLGMKWKNLGPDNIGGRTRAIVIDKDNPDVLYTGGVSGGFWKSTNKGTTWNRKSYSGDFTNLCIVSITQATNGDIYFGTGESDISGGGDRGGSGNIGMGIWKSTDKGESWTHLESTIPTRKFNSNDGWANVSDLAADPNNPQRLFAGTSGGLKISNDGGQSWDNADNNALRFRSILDIKIAADGQFILVATATNGFKSTDGGNTFDQIRGENFPSGGNIGRIEFAIATSDPDYGYAAISDRSGNLMGVYQSKDQGESWNNIGQGADVFNPFGGQGTYNNVIAVDPFNKKRVFLGGVDFWRWENNTWNQVASENEFSDNDERLRNPTYMHVDHHEITFDTKSETPRMYIGNDGGIYASSNFQSKQPTYKSLNQGYNVTQFYALAASREGQIIGGTQDNNTLKIERKGLQGTDGTDIFGGDGFYSEISRLRPSAYFFTQQFASFGDNHDGIQRSNDRGRSSEGIFSTYLLNNYNRNTFPFNTPYALWEKGNDTLTADTTIYSADTSVVLKRGQTITVNNSRLQSLYDNDQEHLNQINNSTYQARKDLSQLPGDTVEVRSDNGIFFDFELPHALGPIETVKVQDIKQTKLIMAIRDEVWLTTDALNFSVTPTWHRIASDVNLNPTSIDVSDDGKSVIVGGFNKIIKIDNIRQVHYTENNANDQFDPDEEGLEIETYNFNHVVTGVAFAPDNKSTALVTLGNYGAQNHVYYTDNFTDSTQNVAFQNVTSNLPSMPVYDGVFHAKDQDTVILGTELGIWATKDITTNTVQWTEQNTGMQRVPTHMIKQVIPNPKWDNSGSEFYIATHGRGIFRSTSLNPLAGQNEKQDELVKNQNNEEDILSLHPNPATDYTNVKVELSSDETIQGNIYDLNGTKVKAFQLKNDQSNRINITDLKPGQYIIGILGEKEQASSKLVVR